MSTFHPNPFFPFFNIRVKSCGWTFYPWSTFSWAANLLFKTRRKCIFWKPSLLWHVYTELARFFPNQKYIYSCLFSLGIASVVFHTRQDCCSFPGCMHHPPQYCTQWWLLQIRQILTDSNLIIQSRRRTMRFEIESSFHFLLWDLHNAPLAAMQWFQCRQDRWRLMQDPFHDAKKYFHSNFKRELNWANLSDRENWEAMIQIILLIYNWLLYADIKLWMLSSATLYYQVTMFVILWGYQLSEMSTISQLL